MKKVMIIALDGLEPSLVTEAMPNLLQREHGIINVNISPLQTPLIWATFLTGTKENGVKTLTIPYRLQEKISSIFGYDKVARLSSIASKSKLYELNPFSKYIKQYTKDDLIHPTLFDLVDKYVALDIPAYNENPVYVKIRQTIALAINGQYLKENLESESWELFHNEYDICLHMIKKDWELFMVHFFITDVMGHLCWNNMKRLKACYQTMDEYIGEINSRVNDSVIFIVSDHGMQSGLHTHKGFYSVNQQLNLNLPKITDFYEIIRKVLLS